MQPSIFKSYDIRGVFPHDLDAAACRRIGKALAKLYSPKHALVGRDMRVSSTELESAVVEGLRSSGVNVTLIGLCSTPMFNFAVGDSNGFYDLGIMVTASHNPSEYNGLKLVGADGLPIGSGMGMEELRDLSCSDQPLLDNNILGDTDRDETVLERYARHVLSCAHLRDTIVPFQIAIDAGNGMNGLTQPVITKFLRGSRVIPLYYDLDGSFPHHEANPLKLETLKDLQERVKRDECDFGVAYDADGDRVGFIDERGDVIPGDILTALFARELLRDQPSGLILCDVRGSWSVQDIVSEAGGKSEYCRVGHAHIKKQMRDSGALFAGELSGHFYFRDMWNCESSDLALLLMARILSSERRPLSSVWKPLRRYAHSGEINFNVNEPKAVLERITELFTSNAPSSISRIDGVRMEFQTADGQRDWWFSLRSSNTEPLLRLNCEARTVADMNRHRDELSAMIRAT